MRVMIDTNIFISAALFPNGKAAAALKKALLPPYQTPGLRLCGRGASSQIVAEFLSL